jgi:RNA polymerase sigma-70 factor (ECF subfamily)
VFNLYVLDNYSHKEIAELLNISEGTSKSNLSRARAILKQKVVNYQAK